MHEAVISALRDFTRERYSIDWTIEDAETALLTFLEDNELLDVDTSRRGTTIPEIDYPHRSAEYIVGAYVRYLQETYSGDLAYLDTIVKGNMLANALFLPDPHEPFRKFRSTEIYFDTPFLIYALGYAGESRQSPTVELLELLYEVGADLRCVGHTLEEVIGAPDVFGAQLARARDRSMRMVRAFPHSNTSYQKCTGPATWSCSLEGLNAI